MMFDHNKETEYVLKSLRFRHDGREFTGRGTLTYSPEAGMRVQAFLDQSAPRISMGDPGTVHIEDSSDQSPVRFKGDYFAGVIPNQFARALGNSLFESRLSLSPERVLFFQRFPHRAKRAEAPKFWEGAAVLAHNDDFDFPDELHTVTTLNKQTIAEQTRGGLSHEEATGLSIWGRNTADGQFTVSWALPRSTHSKQHEWRWGEAVRRALSIVFAQTVWIVRRESTRGTVEITELRSKNKVETLGHIHRPITDFGPPDHRKFNKKAFLHLAHFFASNDARTDICWSIFRRLAEASSQETWESRELLEATTLEAALRTLANHPFRPGDHSWKVIQSLESFRRRYLNDRWKNSCKKVLRVRERLRHRNAHPDWITHPDGSFSKPEWRESIEDLTYLSRFYGYMILAIAGFKDIEPKFPQVRFKN